MMAIETERRWLIPTLPEYFSNTVSIDQGYLSNPGTSNVVRVRMTASSNLLHSFLTIKTPNGFGSSHEFEYEIPNEDASQLLNRVHGNIVQKQRHFTFFGGRMFEIDVFSDPIKCIIVELELDSIDEVVDLPSWVLAGTEITGNKNLSNFKLAFNPIGFQKELDTIYEKTLHSGPG